MGRKPKSKGRLNVYFSQTAKAFRAARQTQIFAKLKRNIPYMIGDFSRTLFEKNLPDKITTTYHEKKKEFKKKLPPFAKKIK